MKYIKAEFHDNRTDNYLECMQLNSLFVCASKSNDITNLQRLLLQGFNSSAEFLGRAHLVYDQADFIDEVRQHGYTIQEFEIILPINETTINELDLSYCETKDCELFIFKNLAIRANDKGLEVFCKVDMNLVDIAEHWSMEDGLNESQLDVKCMVPHDALGALAVNVDRLQYACWELFERAPGESIDVEERLEGLTILSASLSQGDDLSDVMEECAEILQYGIDERIENLQCGNGNNHKFCKWQIDKAKELLSTVEKLGGECKSRVAEISIVENEFQMEQKM